MLKRNKRVASRTKGSRVGVWGRGNHVGCQEWLKSGELVDMNQWFCVAVGQG